MRGPARPSAPGDRAGWRERISRQWARIVDHAVRQTFGVILFPHQVSRLAVVLAGYALVTAIAVWLTAGAPGVAGLCPDPPRKDDACEPLRVAGQLSAAYSPVLVDIGILFALTVVALRRYASGFRRAALLHTQRKVARIETHADSASVTIALDAATTLRALVATTGQDDHFRFPPSIQCTIDASPLGSDLLYQSIQGSLDFAKLRLRRLRREAGNLVLELGSTSYRDLNLAHYWAFLPLAAESTDEENPRPKCLFDLLSPSQIEVIHSMQHVVRTMVDGSSLESLAPNPLGISMFLRVRIDGQSRWLMRRRGHDVAAHPGKLCAAVAGLIDVFPEFAAAGRPTDVLQLLRQEYGDEVLSILADGVKRHMPIDRLALRPLGLVFSAECNYQPELYLRAEIDLDAVDPPLRPDARGNLGLVTPRRRKTVVEVADLAAVDPEDIRPVDRAAIRAFL